MIDFDIKKKSLIIMCKTNEQICVLLDKYKDYYYFKNTFYPAYNIFFEGAEAVKLLNKMRNIEISKIKFKYDTFIKEIVNETDV